MTQYTESVDSAEHRHRGASGKKLGVDTFTDGIVRIVSAGSKRERRKSIVIERPKNEKRPSYSASNNTGAPVEMEYYRLKKMDGDWGLADVVQLPGNRDDMERKVYKVRGRGIVTRMMNDMGPQRRKQITKLVQEKNADEREKDAEWHPAHIETAVLRGARTPIMYVILAKRYKTFEGKKSDIRDAGKAKGKDDKGGKYKKETANYDDPFESDPLVDENGRLCDSGGLLHSDDYATERLPGGELEPVGGRVERERSRSREPRRLKDKHPDDHFDDHYDDHGHDGVAIVGEDDYLPDGPTPVIPLDDFNDSGTKKKRGGHDKYEHSHSRGGHAGFDEPTAEAFDIKGDHRRPNSKSRSRPQPKHYHTDDPRMGHHRGRGRRDSASPPHSIIFGSSDGGDTFSSIKEDEHDLDAYHYDIKPRGSLSRHASPSPGHYKTHHRTQSYNVASRPPSVRYYDGAAVYEPGRTPRRPSDFSPLAYDRHPVRGLIGYDGYDMPDVGGLRISSPPPVSRRYSSYDVPPPVPAAPDPYESRLRYVEEYTDDLATRERRVSDQERQMDEIDYHKWKTGPRSVYGGSGNSGGRGYYPDRYAPRH